MKIHYRRLWSIVLVGAALIATVVVGARYAAAPAQPVGKVHLADYYPSYARGAVTLPDQTVVDVLIADTSKRQEQGLSGVATFSANEGMLFVFDHDEKYTFWMKDMLLPIDMIWLDADKKVVHIAAAAEPSSYPDTFTPAVPARSVLEVTSGFAQKHGLTVGQQMQF